jgi:hypothetical protein
MEPRKKFKLPQLTPIGGRSSGEEENTSSISTTRSHLMSIKIMILKDNKLSSGRNTMAGIKDGELHMSTKLRKKLLRDMTVNTDSTSTEHCTSDQDFQCGELLNL